MSPERINVPRKKEPARLPLYLLLVFLSLDIIILTDFFIVGSAKAGQYKPIFYLLIPAHFLVFLIFAYCLRLIALRTIRPMRRLMMDTSRTLSVSEAKYFNLIERASDGIFILQDDRIVFSNPKFQEMTGYHEDELAQEGILYKLLSPREARIIRERHYQRIRGEMVSPQFEVTIFTKGGETLRVELSPSVIEFGGRVATQNIARDITERKKLERKIRVSERMHRNLVEQANDGIFILREGRLLYSNPKFQEMLGYSAEELKGLEIRKIIPTKELQPLEVMENPSVATQPIRRRTEATFITKAGIAYVFEVSSTAIEYEGHLAMQNIVRDVTERKELEEQLKNSLNLLENLIQNSVEGILTADLKGKMLVFNQSAEKILGYNPTEVIGNLNIEQFYPPGRAREIMRMIRSEEYGGRGRLNGIETEMLDKEGRLIPVHVSAAMLYDADGKDMASMGIITDLREKVRLESSLDQSEKKYRALIEQSYNGLFIYKENRFAFINKRFQEMTGYSQEDLQALSLRDLLSPKDYLKVDRMYQRMMKRQTSGPLLPLQVTMRKKDGEEVEYELTASRIEFEDGVATQNSIRDVTEVKRLEAQLLQANKLAALGELSGGLAHQLNNPLVGVVNLGQLLLSRMDAKDKNRQHVESMVKAGQECSEIIKNLLRFSRESQYNFQLLDVNRVIDIALSFSERYLSNRGVRLVKEYDAKLPRVLGNETQLSQVFLNLIHNAAQAMPEGGSLTISTGLDDMEDADLETENRRIKIAFRDTGIGIPPQYLKKIFDPFFTTKEEGKGTGLGLSVAYAIIEGHRGLIRVTSEEGKGSLFTILLPVEEEAEEKIRDKFFARAPFFRRLFRQEDLKS